MEDEKIVNLYLERSETAISETQKKYGRYCFTVAYNVLYSKEDAEECVNDTFEKAWNSIPPQKPRIISAFLGAITRNLALDRYEQSHAKKRYSPAETALDACTEFIFTTRTVISSEIFPFSFMALSRMRSASSFGES